MTARFLDAAIAIGRELCAKAIVSEGECVWLIPSARKHADPLAVEPTDPYLYNGSAGVALFLSELAGITGDKDAAKTAERAIRSCLRRDREAGLGQSIGLHTGRTGVAYVAWRLGELTGRDEFGDEARRIIADMSQQIDRDANLDVIGGSAGAIPVLLLLGRHAGFNCANAMAVTLGDRLLQQAHRCPEGWSWGGHRHNVRDLTGYGHGSSGFALALLELATVTGAARFFHASTQAFGYEQFYFDPDGENWHDLRYGELSKAIYDQGEDAARKYVRGGDSFARNRTMAAWCHGAPGIAMARIRAYALTRDDAFDVEAHAGARRTLRSMTSNELQNSSLCHGSSGNGDILIQMSEVFDEPDWRKAVESRMSDEIDIAERADGHWPSGWAGRRPHPCLMIGNAGIGHALLRLATRDVPPVLHIAPKLATSAPASFLYDLNIGPLRIDDTRRYTHCMQTVGGSILAQRAAEPLPMEPTSEGPPVLATLNAVRARIDREPDSETRDLLRDIFAVDMASVDLMSRDLDLGAEFIEELAHEAPDEVQWGVGIWRLSVRAKLVLHRWNWLRSYADASWTEPVARADGTTYTLIVRREYDLERHLVVGLTGLILSALVDPSTLSDVVSAVAAGSEGIADGELELAIIDQLRAAHRAGIVVRAWDRAPIAAASESLA